MTPPNLQTRVLGSPWVAPFVMVGSAFATYVWWREGCENILGFFTIGILCATSDALEKVSAYRQWRADWEGMAPEGRPKGPRQKTIKTLLGVVVVAAVWLFACQPEAPPELHDWMILAGLAWATAAVTLLVTRGLWHALTRRQSRRSRPLVAVAVRRPVANVPSLQAAYQRLPAYCQQLLRGRA